MSLTKVQPEMLLGGGSGGTGKNYLSYYLSNPGNGDFEAGTTAGWSLLTTTLTGVLPTGGLTFSAASVGTFNAVSAGKLAGYYSLSTISSGVWAAGQGFISEAFTIDIEDQAKSLAFSCAYKVVSGGSNLNFSGTSSNTFAVYIYDVTNSAWIQPAGVYNLVQNSGVGECSGSFQTTSNSTQYRIAVIAINASGGASNLLWDDFFVGPQPVISAPGVSDWVSFTPTPFAWTSNATYTGRWRRVGDSMDVQVGIAVSGAVGGTPLALNLPSGYSIDTSKILTTVADNQPIGTGTCLDAGNAVYPLQVTYKSTTSVTVSTLNASSTYATNNTVNSSTPFVFGSGDGLWVEFSVPIAGWSSNSVMSQDTDTRVVTASITTLASTTATNGTALALTTTVFDTHAAWNGTNSYIVPVAGYYNIALQITSVASGGGSIYVYKNGSAVNGATVSSQIAYSSSAIGVGGSLNVSCKAGDILTVVPGFSATFNNTGAVLSINRLSGPAVIAATDTVAARYSNVAGTSVGTADTILPFPTKDFDYTNSFVGATGIFTAPVSGLYYINSNVRMANISITVTLNVYKNGAFFCTLDSSTNSTAFCVGGSTLLKAVAGDTISIYAKSSGNTALDTTAGINYVNINRVGN